MDVSSLVGKPVGAGGALIQKKAEVDLVKAYQRKSGVWKTAWAQYCARHTSPGVAMGTRDPGQHSLTFLQAALRELGPPAEESRAAAQGLLPGLKESLVKEVKDRQKESALFKRVWSEYVSAHGGGKRDPAAHEAAFLQQALVRCEESVAAAGDTSELDRVVERVKQGMKASADWAARWREFAEVKGNVTGAAGRDPALYDLEFLRASIQHCGEPPVPVTISKEPLPLAPDGRRACKYWHAYGNCRNGDKCGWSHGALSLPPSSTLGRGASTRFDPYGGAGRSEAADWGVYQCSICGCMLQARPGCVVECPNPACQARLPVAAW
eukprot:TRINITY_DN8283_c0_g1_i1.p1 TRINITY_DN8283_c0_g1~~TRINITY_DN8283_c0_g1_i1.p1  ORF type:complete len:324 (+),score=67.70 TRINITY_DN8283_c0_g1_i1:83-1054(+)